VVASSEGDVSEDSPIEQYALLLHKSDVVSQPVDIKLTNGCAIDKDIASSWFIESHQQVSDCALSRTTLANHESRLSSWEKES
jgi:hypothetical protein